MVPSLRRARKEANRPRVQVLLFQVPKARKAAVNTVILPKPLLMQANARANASVVSMTDDVTSRAKAKAAKVAREVVREAKVAKVARAARAAVAVLLTLNLNLRALATVSASP